MKDQKRLYLPQWRELTQVKATDPQNRSRTWGGETRLPVDAAQCGLEPVPYQEWGAEVQGGLHGRVFRST